jgi:thiamine pyrophosphate-dependent acetolactate synthase large subunit-like protein
VPKMNAGSAIVQCLRAEKVRYAFGIIGSSYLEVLDAFYDPPDIDFVSVRHELAATHIADAYARVTGGIGVCLAQGGPGVTNLVTGMALAKHAFSPVLALGGATMTTHDQRDAFQEVDQLSVLRPVSKAVMRIGRADRAPELTRHAIRTAITGRRGPVFVEMPRDLLSHETEFTPMAPEEYRPVIDAGVNPAVIEAAVRLLRSAKKPLVVAGSGLKWSRGAGALLALVEALDIPFVTSNANRDLVPNDHRLFFGQLGPRGSSIARELAQEADVIFALGTRLGFTTAFFNYNFINRAAKLIHCDIEATEVGRLYPVAVGIVGDAKAVAEACLIEARRAQARQSLAEWHAWTQARRQEWQAARDAGIEEAGSPIRTARFFAELRRAVPRNIHVVTDAGYWGNTATDAFDHFESPSLFTPQEFGCLGFCFPAGLGVKFARPEAPVLCVNGDGGFAMNMQELETAVRCKLNPVVLVLNNFSWGVEKSYQKDFFDQRYVGANIGNPRFDLLAESFGARGVRVERAEDIAEVVREAFRSPLPTVVDVIADPGEMSGLRRDAVVARKAPSAA